MQDASNFHDVGFGDAVEKEMPRESNPSPRPSCGLAAEIEMIGSAMLADFGPLTAASNLGILRDWLNRGRNEFGVTLQGLRAEFSSVQARMLAMSFRALGATMTSIFLSAVPRCFGPDLGF